MFDFKYRSKLKIFFLIAKAFFAEINQLRRKIDFLFFSKSNGFL